MWDEGGKWDHNVLASASGVSYYYMHFAKRSLAEDEPGRRARPRRAHDGPAGAI